MKHFFRLSIFLLALCSAENTVAQTEVSPDGYRIFPLAALESATLTDIEPEVGYDITSYTVTIACERKDLQEFACTGDTLSAAFYSTLRESTTENCMCYFDKIMAGNEPRKGFVIDVRK